MCKRLIRVGAVHLVLGQFDFEISTAEGYVVEDAGGCSNRRPVASEPIGIERREVSLKKRRSALV